MQGWPRAIPRLGTLGVISPHLDDAALSCGQMLCANPGSHVITVFSSGPSSVRPLPSWDEMSGSFRPGDDVMALRALEDDAALAIVGAYGHRLGFWDEQYRAGPPIRLARFRPLASRAARATLDDPVLQEQVKDKLREIITSLPVETWFVPLGLWHGDHKKTAGACLQLACEIPECRWVVYEELPYRLEVAEEVALARRHISSTGFDIDPLETASSTNALQKRAMVACYRSQVPCLGDRADLAIASPEVFGLLKSRHTGIDKTSGTETPLTEPRSH